MEEYRGYEYWVKQGNKLDTLEDVYDKFDEMCGKYYYDSNDNNCYSENGKCKYNDCCNSGIGGFMGYLNDNYNVILEEK